MYSVLHVRSHDAMSALIGSTLTLADCSTWRINSTTRPSRTSSEQKGPLKYGLTANVMSDPMKVWKRVENVEWRDYVIWLDFWLIRSWTSSDKPAFEWIPYLSDLSFGSNLYTTRHLYQRIEKNYGCFARGPVRPESFRPDWESFRPDRESFRPEYEVVSPGLRVHTYTYVCGRLF